MIKAYSKTLMFALLLLSLSGQPVTADVKVYQYDGKLPFVQMMLNMMVAMGILDRLPSNGRYGMSAYPASRWAQSPWSSSAVNGVAWGSPNWGVLPVESYARSAYGYGPYNSLPANRYWSADELNGWVNEPWETSQWNPRAEIQGIEPSPQTPQQQQPVPLVQNFNYNAPAPADKAADDRMARQSPLVKLAPSVRPPAGPPVARDAGPARRQSPLNKRMYQQPAKKSTSNKLRQKPCVTDFCGLKKPNLDGLWVAQDGEMLGIKNNRYLWSDSSSRYLTGKIKIQNEYLVANVDGYDRLMRFKYKLAGNHLLTMQPDGKIREFTRMRADQYSNYAQGNRDGYMQPYYQ